MTLGTFPGIGLSHHDALYPDQGPLIRQLRPRNFRGKETIVPKCSVVGIIPRDRVNSIDCCTLYNGHQRSWKGRSALISLFIAVLQAMYKIQTWYRRSFCMVVISLFFLSAYISSMVSSLLQLERQLLKHLIKHAMLRKKISASSLLFLKKK